MLSYLRAVPSRTVRSWSITYHRSISSSHVLRARARAQPEEDVEEYDEDEEFDEDFEGDEADGQKRDEDTGASYDHWLSTQGSLYRDPLQPRNWLSRHPEESPDHPFPLNPSFRPPAPLSDKLRSQIYEEYMQDPNVNSVRELSSRYGLSVNRVDAILRLKGLEADWTKGKQVQTGFLAGMELILDVSQDVSRDSATATRTSVTEGDAWAVSHDERYDVSEADALDEVEGRNVDREKYQRMFWEDVVEGQEPVVPTALEKGKIDAAQGHKDAFEAKSDPALLGIPDHVWRRRLRRPQNQRLDPERKTRMLRDRYETLFYEPSVRRDDLIRLELGREGKDPWAYTSRPNTLITRSGASESRPHIKFEDVGGKFLDVRDRVRRIKESERRVKIKERKRTGPQDAVTAARVPA